MCAPWRTISAYAVTGRPVTEAGTQRQASCAHHAGTRGLIRGFFNSRKYQATADWSDPVNGRPCIDKGLDYDVRVPQHCLKQHLCTAKRGSVQDMDTCCT